MTKKIPLTLGKVTLVDDDVYEFLMQWKWHAKKIPSGVWYACRSQKAHPHEIRMHRVVMNVTDPEREVDHKDHNGLNNQRYNLRECSHSQNSQNSRPRSKTGLKGVFPVRSGKYICQIKVNGKVIHLGTFSDPIEAARVRDQASIKYFGEFAYLNFPEHKSGQVPARPDPMVDNRSYLEDRT
jgi:hypothetical protein